MSELSPRRYRLISGGASFCVFVFIIPSVFSFLSAQLFLFVLWTDLAAFRYELGSFRLRSFLRFFLWFGFFLHDERKSCLLVDSSALLVVPFNRRRICASETAHFFFPMNLLPSATWLPWIGTGYRP